jgi:hypothetical protein
MRKVVMKSLEYKVAVLHLLSLVILLRLKSNLRAVIFPIACKVELCAICKIMFLSTCSRIKLSPEMSNKNRLMGPLGLERCRGDAITRTQKLRRARPKEMSFLKESLNSKGDRTA